MQNSEATWYESAANGLIEDINQLDTIALGAGAGICQVCGERIPEGSPITVYAFRPAGASHWRVDHSKCDADRSHRTENFTLGVRELLVDGRVGCVSDQATQSYWRVLVAPCVRAVSPAWSTNLFGVCWFALQVRESCLARAGDLTLMDSTFAELTDEGPATALDPQTGRSPQDPGESASDPMQLTLDTLAVDSMGEDA